MKWNSPNGLPGSVFRAFLALLVLFSILTEASGKSNIILIMPDERGWAQVGYYDHPHLKGKASNLEATAANGIRFDRSDAGASICTPTRGTVMTGRTSGRNSTTGLHQRLCLQKKIIPQALLKAVYKTARFGEWRLNGVKRTPRRKRESFPTLNS